MEGILMLTVVAIATAVTVSLFRRVEMEKTDREIGAILEALQDVAPGVAEQAVLYERFLMSVWLGIMMLVVLVAGVAFKACWVQWGELDSEVGAWVFGFIGCVACFICVILAACLGGSYIAPDYYAADCMVELGRKALGH